MTDIVELLRDGSEVAMSVFDLQAERYAAADEIERLRAQLAEATAAWHDRDTRLLAVEARLAEAEAKRETQLRQQGEAWAADAARYKARLAERELSWLNQQEQIKDLTARLAEAEALLREYRLANDERGPMFWCGLNQRADAFLTPSDSASPVPVLTKPGDMDAPFGPANGSGDWSKVSAPAAHETTCPVCHVTNGHSMFCTADQPEPAT